jgi:hypothetical protein
MPRYLDMNSFGFKRILRGGVKRFTQDLKASMHHSKTLIGVVSRSYRATTFSRKGSWIPKRLRIYSVVTNYIRSVQIIYFYNVNLHI